MGNIGPQSHLYALGAARSVQKRPSSGLFHSTVTFVVNLSIVIGSLETVISHVFFVFEGNYLLTKG